MKYKKQIKTNHYYSMQYNHLGRFNLYWHQINEVMKFNPKNVLEVGCGAKIVEFYLNQSGVSVDTLDIDTNLKPTYNISITEIGQIKKKYDVVLLGEVLEHITYSDFLYVMKDISEITDNLIITLPEAGYLFFIDIKIPIFPRIQFSFKIQKCFLKHEFDGQHYWEIGKKNYLLGKIKKDLITQGWIISNSYSIKESFNHRLFVLNKKL